MRKKISLSASFFVLIIFLVPKSINAQSCGFGCLGLAGFKAGYSYQTYSANGFNDFLTVKFSSAGDISIPKYEAAKGFRLGANFFRAQFADFFLTAKGYFQFLKEEHEILSNVGVSDDKHLYRMKLNHFGLGVDFGIPLFTFLDWKIVEGGMNFYNAEIELETFKNQIKTSDIEFENTQTDIGYYVASGLIIHIVKDYISVEGSAIFNFFKINELSSGDDQVISTNNNVIDSGGFGAAVQLNLGVPL